LLSGISVFQNKCVLAHFLEMLNISALLTLVFCLNLYLIFFFFHDVFLFTINYIPAKVDAADPPANSIEFPTRPSIQTKHENSLGMNQVGQKSGRSGTGGSLGLTAIL